MSVPTVRAAVLHMLPAQLGAAGLDADAIFGAGGMRAAATATPALVHRAQVSAVLNMAARVLDRPEIGLALGAAADPARLGSAGLALVGGTSIGECLRAHARSMPALQTHVRLGLRTEGERAVWSHRLEGEPEGASSILYEGAAAFHLRFLRALLGVEWSPTYVLFPHARRGRALDYEEHFGAPVVFGETADTRIVFDKAVLRRRVAPRADSSRDGGDARSVPAPQAYQLRDSGLLDVLRTIVTARLPHGPVTLIDAAGVLGVAPRTLQRRLVEAGTSFEALVDGLRRTLAMARIHEGAPVTRVAMSLGYSDTAHFTRAFRRWTGRPPTTFRGEALALERGDSQD
ncbi:AraC family transcriptional regulator [Alsobacter sp. SYSU M60028]|uniref:AraC family transcriptional regulator n=1 Tax=Alsobacter ponti TaxID=2962936 RepID=A0ABT1L7M2_9HYPH|nr:AraC family transcriptional regulator [Alsobacter ponti]MCP8937485.1 AraC family transcriptional regulator [Alsobacter ponti]